jgi:hypothetical protein
MSGSFPGRRNAADNLVAGNQCLFRVGKVAIDDMKISSAHPAGIHLYKDLLRTR